MKAKSIENLLKLLNSHKTGTRGSWVLGHCVLGPWNHGGRDQDPSFGIKENSKGRSFCKCMSCGFGGDLMDLVMEVKRLQAKSYAPGYNLALAGPMVLNETDEIDLVLEVIPEYGDPIPEEEEPFPQWWLDSFMSASKFPEAMAYLASRSVSPAMVAFLDVRYDPTKRRVGFPFRDSRGRIMGMQGRAIDKSEDLRYYQYGFKDQRNGTVWMGEDRIDLDRPIVLCEGPLDLTSILRCYDNVLASFTSGLSMGRLRRIRDASEIVTFYDFGKGGYAARTRISEFFKSIPVSHVIPTKEQDDSGNMSFEEVVSALEGKVPLKVFGA